MQKKKQKNVPSPWGVPPPAPQPTVSKSFFASFFSKKEVLACLIGAALCLICIAFIDRPVALFVHAHIRHHARWVFDAMAAPSLLTLPLSLLFFAGYALLKRQNHPPGALAMGGLRVGAAVLAATALKDELKWMFGRPWPESWIVLGMYRFKPFASSHLYGGFPSGHTAYISAPLLVLCWLAPKYTWLWLGLILMVMVGLVGGGYHFVGDTIAGLLTGWAAAAGTRALMPR